MGIRFSVKSGMTFQILNAARWGYIEEKKVEYGLNIKHAEVQHGFTMFHLLYYSLIHVWVPTCWFFTRNDLFFTSLPRRWDTIPGCTGKVSGLQPRT